MPNAAQLEKVSIKDKLLLLTFFLRLIFTVFKRETIAVGSFQITYDMIYVHGHIIHLLYLHIGRYMHTDTPTSVAEKKPGVEDKDLDYRLGSV